MAVPSGTFPVYLSPRLLAELVRRFAHLLGDNKPAASTLIRLLLEDIAGEEDAWEFQDTQLAIDFLREQGYSVKQFTGKRFMRGQAKEEMQEPEGKPTTAGDLRRQALLIRIFQGETLTLEEQEELEL
jgi:hypothetical protein